MELSSHHLQLEFGDWLRICRSLLVSASPLSSSWESHAPALELLAFLVGGNDTTHQRLSNGLVVQRNAAAMNVWASDKQMLHNAVVFPLLLQLFSPEKEWHPVLITKGVEIFVALSKLGVCLSQPLVDAAIALARSESDVLSVGLKMELLKAADTSMSSSNKEVDVTLLHVAQALGVAPVCDLVLGRLGDKGKILATEIVWNYEQNAALSVAGAAVEAVQRASDLGIAQIEDLLSVATWWAKEKLEADGFGHCFRLLASLGEGSAVVDFLLAWSTFPGRLAVPKLTLLTRVLPQLKKGASDSFRSSLITLTEFLKRRERPAGLEHLVLAASSLVDLMSSPSEFPKLFQLLCRRFLPYASLVYLRLIDGCTNVKKAIILSGLRQDLQLLHACQSVVLADSRFEKVWSYAMQYGLPDSVVKTDCFAPLLLLLLMLNDVGCDDDVIGVRMRIERMLLEGSLEREALRKASEDSARLILFRSLYGDMLKELRARNAEPDELVQAFQQAFPADVLADEKTMRSLNLLAQRIMSVRQRGRYPHVVDLTVQAAQVFLGANGGNLAERRARLEEFVAALPSNVRASELLLASGYSPQIFGPLSTLVATGVIDSSEDTFRTSLFALVQKYIPLLRAEGIEKVGGKAIDKLFDLFSSCDQWLSERSLVVAALSMHHRPAIKMQLKDLLERENVLLRKDVSQDQPQNNQNQQQSAKVFRIRLNSTLNSWASCDKYIEGCYAPSGVHAEKPLECGLKLNNRLWSLLSDGEGFCCVVLCCVFVFVLLFWFCFG